MNSVSHIILATLLSTGTAVAQETVDFDRHDTDNDGFLTEQEWNDIDAAETDFDTLDVDEDGMLSEAEVMATQDVELEAEPESGADLDRREVTAEDHSNVQRGRIDRNADEEDPTLGGVAASESDEAAIADDDTEAERETDEQQATTDVATEEDDQAGFATAEDADERDGMQAAADDQGTTDATARDDAGDEEEQAGFATAEDVDERDDTQAAADDQDTTDATARDDAGDEEEQAGFATAEDVDERDGMQAASDEDDTTDTADTDIEPTGGLEAQPDDVAAEDSAAVVEQPDVEIQNVDTTRARDEADAADSQAGDGAPEMQGVGERPDPMQNGLAALSEESLQAFQEADANNDELISKDEAKEAGFDYVAIHFDALDENNSDSLEPQEWNPAAQQQDDQAAPGIRDAGATEEPLYEEPDDVDGETDRDAVAAGTMPLEGEEGAVAFEEDFDTYDINQDGYIDSDEADEALLDDELFERLDIDDNDRIDSEEAGTGLEFGNDDEDDGMETGEDA